jgi:hypothetical protein
MDQSTALSEIKIQKCLEVIMAFFEDIFLFCAISKVCF